MNINALKREMKKLEKFFVDPSGEIYTATELHEKLAREICEKNHWEWKLSGLYSAEDFLLEKKGYIKVAKYDVFKYVAMSKIYVKNKHIFENAIYISELLNLKLEIYYKKSRRLLKTSCLLFIKKQKIFN